VEPALDLEVLRPLLARDELGDSVAQLLEQVVVVAHWSSSLARWRRYGRRRGSVTKKIVEWRGHPAGIDPESGQITRRRLVTEIRTAHRARIKPRSAQVGADQGRVGAQRAEQVRPAKVGGVGVGPREIGEGEVTPREVV